MAVKAEMVTEKTLPTKTFSKLHQGSPFQSSKGFTLLEVMVVLGILAAVLAVGLPRINLKNDNIKQVVRDLSLVIRETRNQARIKNRTYRIVFNLDEKSPAYWVESAEGGTLAPSQTTLEKLEESSQDEKRPSPFQKDTKIIKKDRSLPGALRFGVIETTRTLDLDKPKQIEIYFSPEGLTEHAAIQVTNGNQLTWTLIINPLTGHADIIEKATTLKDVQSE